MKAVIEAEDIYCCKVKACMVELPSEMTKGRLVRTVECEGDVDPEGGDENGRHGCYHYLVEEGLWDAFILLVL